MRSSLVPGCSHQPSVQHTCSLLDRSCRPAGVIWEAGGGHCASAGVEVEEDADKDVESEEDEGSEGDGGYEGDDESEEDEGSDDNGEDYDFERHMAEHDGLGIRFGAGGCDYHTGFGGVFPICKP